MKLIQDPDKPLDFDISATIGNFDGVHRGHKEILLRVKENASKNGLKSCVISFYPHPQKVIRGTNIPLIVPLEDRFNMLEKEGIDVAVCFNFTKEMSLMTASEFVSEILVGLLKIKNITVGPDFSFGKGREGNTTFLKEIGERLNFNVDIVGPVYYGDTVVSSTSIRNLISEGEIDKANKLLGYQFYLRGEIVEGERRGRSLGFPTMNLSTNWEILPKVGVYATFTELFGKKYNSITNIGFRPTFGENRLMIETHILDFDQDIYGKEAKVEFVERIRDEKKFGSVDQLVEQIKRDIDQVEKILNEKSL